MPALASIAPATWQTVDGLTSATLLRISRSEFGYIRQAYDNSHHINVVDVQDPTKTVSEKAVVGEKKDGRQVIQWTTDNNGKIAAVVSKTISDTNNAEHLIVYNSDLSVLKRFSFSSPADPGHNLSTLAGESAPVKLALSEKYAISGWREYTGTGREATIHDAGLLIGSLTSDKTGKISLEVLGDEEAKDIVAVVTKGDYAIISNGSGATGVYRINAAAEEISLVVETEPDSTREAAWLLTNGSYVLETSEAPGWLRVWKWNENSKPTAVGIIEPLDDQNNGGPGAVRAVTFDSGDPGIAYHLDRLTREISRIDLASGTRTKLFKLSEYTAGPEGKITTQSIWNIQRETNGTNTYYVLGGSLGSNNRSNGVVLVLKNPPVDGSDITEVVNADSPQYLDSTTSWLEFDTVGSVRSTRSLQDSIGNIYYVAKNLTASPYHIRVVKMNP